MPAGQKYWFAAKRYGWGLGLLAWQGWVKLAAFVGFVVVGVFAFPPRREAVTFAVYLVALTIGLLGICWAKGEPPPLALGR
jgi:hypothetical protein